MSKENDDQADRLIKETIEAGVMTITLNRPERMNALTEAMLLQFRAALERAAADPLTRAVLVRAAGRAFCTGQDLSARDPRKFAEPFDLEAIQRELFHPIVTLIRTMEKPVVIAVHGAAAGAGASIAIAGDIVLAADDAKFIWSFAKVGLSVDAGAGHTLVQALGAARARALLLTAGSLSGSEAAAAGLIWRSMPESELQDEASAIARRLAEGPTLGYGLIKKAVAAAETMPFDEYLADEARLQGIAGRSEDYREGVLSFLEKRPAAFKSR
ncbi:2-(1,2-epoxy-1,2-dihydrophenyl)acetyl-CoA isomerase [Rhizobium albus]|nr:2-(1,2-epoxy-1,2-dihydrophenyl)acetyl-CoA isomerase [Rhizobium albus]